MKNRVVVQKKKGIDYFTFLLPAVSKNIFSQLYITIHEMLCGFGSINEIKTF